MISSCSLDLNWIENLRGILKFNIDGRQFTRKDELWNVILEALHPVLYEVMQPLPKSTDEQLILVSGNGAYI